MISKNKKRLKKKIRIRKKIQGTTERPRLVVFRSIHNIYAQIIDDTKGQTIVSASSLDKEIKEKFANNKKTIVSENVGIAVAKKAIEKNVKTVVFDRNGYFYHGRVKAVSEGARKEGLIF